MIAFVLGGGDSVLALVWRIHYRVWNGGPYGFDSVYLEEMMGTLARLMVTLMVLRMAAMPFSAEEIALAQIMQGEANHQFIRSYVPAYGVGWVARNRLESGEYGTSYQEMQAGFNGAVNRAPQWKYMALARLVMNRQRDPTGGALYVLSQQDMNELGFDESEATLILRASEYRALFFFVEWPGGGRESDNHP